MTVGVFSRLLLSSGREVLPRDGCRFLDKRQHRGGQIVTGGCQRRDQGAAPHGDSSRDTG